MPRKHQPGCPCCGGGCYELLPEDLPTVTPPTGWSLSGDWTGTDCCKCITMTPNTTTWTDQCSGIFGTAEQDYNCAWDIIAWELPTPNVLTTNVCPSDGTPYCTTKNKFKAGEGTGRMYCKEEWKLLLSSSPVSITLCISKQNVDCGTGPELKWVLSSQYCYSIQTWAVRNRQREFTRTITATHSCFRKPTSPIPETACDFSSTESFTHECTRDAAIADVAAQNGDAVDIDSGIPGGVFCFCRHKFFDLHPTGNITFSNTDVLGACELEFTCNSTGCDESTQVCVAVNSWPCSVRPCWCDATWEITENTNQICYQQNCISGACGPGGLVCTDPLRCVQFDVLNPPECDTVGVLRCCLPVTDPGCFDVSDFVLSVVTPTPLTNCCRTSNTNLEGDCSITIRDYTGITPICHVSASLSPAPFCIEPLYDCGSLTCDATCCYDLDCDQCRPKYQVIGRDETSLTFNVLCTFSPRSLCVSAPSWTLNLA